MSDVVDTGGDRRRNRFLKIRLVCLCLVVVPLLVVYAMKQSQLSELDRNYEAIESKLTALKTEIQDIQQTIIRLKVADDELSCMAIAFSRSLPIVMSRVTLQLIMPLGSMCR